MSNELKPCPFCGGKAEVKVWKRAKVIPIGCLTNNHCELKKLNTKYLVKCSNEKCPVCRPQTKYYYTKKKAVEIWNRRAENDRQRNDKGI